ncbi:MAG: tannase/feruloyl esterase family alpha/beta hydrolase [Acidobacteriaceae bacterium]
MRKLHVFVAAYCFLSGGIFVPAQTAGQTPIMTSREVSCERLTALQLPNVEVTLARTIAAGAFQAPPDPDSRGDQSAFYKKLPAFCRIALTARPSPDSDIKIEVWMPLHGWNGRLQGLGNGGFAGQIDYDSLGAALAKGYAATATDTGHSASGIDASWALGHPEKVIDFGYRGIHEMTGVARAVLQQFYGTAAKYSYFTSCSDGGREALMEAQRYPDDYNGILAGAPANYWTALLSSAVSDTQALTLNPASFIPQAKLPTIAAAVLAACDGLDGVRDGILNDPRQCHFDPASIQCKNGDNSDKCLTAPEVSALNKIYAGLKDTHGHTVFPGYLPGAEEGGNGWGTWITGPVPLKSLMAYFGIRYFSNMVYDNAAWSYKSFAMDGSMDAAKAKTAHALDAVDPNLNPFRAHGGKLILYHGWNDPAIPAMNTVNYYENVLARVGQARAHSFVRLYMVPGMQHCGEGPGPDQFGQSFLWVDDPQRNARVALEQWVEKGNAPAAIVATKTAQEDGQGPPLMTRPLCPYPEFAKYKGSGDTNQAENFFCATPTK